MASQINNAVYDELANTWWRDDGFLQTLHALNPGRFAYFEKLLRGQGIAPQKSRVIDIGCGGGYASERMAKMGMQVVGVDPSRPSLEAAAEHARLTDLVIDYRYGTGEALPVDDATFDVAFCCDVLEHVEDVQQAINEIFRVLKPGGIFFFDTINRSALSWLIFIKLAQDIPFTRSVPKDTHVWHMFIKPEELKQYLVNAGFSPQEMTGFSPSFSPSALVKAAVSRLKGESPQKTAPVVRMGESSFRAGLYMGWAKK